MPRWLGAFSKCHPDMDVSLESLNRDAVVQRLPQNLDDLDLMSMPPAHRDLRDEVFTPTPLVVIASTFDGLGRQAQVALSDLAGPAA